MKACFTTVFVALFLFLTVITNAQTPGKAVVPPDSILKNINNVLQYNSDHLRFGEDFIALDIHDRAITKEEFFKQLITGDYLPLQVYSKNKKWAYRLYKLNNNTDRDARIMLKQIGATYYGLYQSIGKPFPEFHYVDINGKVYSSANTKGKIVVLKAWFTTCESCVAEMPELNKLVDYYKNRKDIVFVSMAFDSKEKLQAFTKRTLFKYAIVAKPAAYIQDTLHVTGYPAHWVINKKGIVVSMSYDHNEMMVALNREAAK